MLIRFSVENFLSFSDEAELSMVAGKPRQHKNHVISAGKRRSIRALKTAVLYGANASGKSNLIKAMSFARMLIIEGRRPRQAILVKPFKLDTALEQHPSKFTFEFHHNEKSFNYGFVVDDVRVYEEWLYEITSTTEKLVFERNITDDGETEFEFGNIKYKNADDREFLRFTSRGTRPNQLFLTESIERGIDYFESAFKWFADVLMIAFSDSQPLGLEAELAVNQDFSKLFQKFLDFFDTGISGVQLVPLSSEEEIPSIIKNFREQFRELKDNNAMTVRTNNGRYVMFKNEGGEIETSKFMIEHHLKEKDRTVLFETTEESEGTQRLFDLIPALMDLHATERVFVIDELDRSLHPHLSHKLLELFLNNTANQASQLIVTTHESNLLDLNLLRRDEIWFVEKDNEGRSNLYSLEEYAVRDDMDIRKGYLLGRFGAIPLIKKQTKQPQVN